MINAQHIPTTRRDPHNRQTVIALAHLLGALDAREHYDQLLQRSIVEYGDRHTPVRYSTPGAGCVLCDNRGHQYDPLNHQTGSVISGIYADHFPDVIKDQLRFYASLISWQTEHAVAAWRMAGRKYSTFRPFMEQSKQLADGRRSYY